MEDILILAITIAAGIAAIYAVIKALGFREYLGGKKAKPWAIPREELLKRLLELNSEKLPFIIRRGNKENCDLVVEWKLADAKWYGIFSKHGLTKWYKAYILLDDERKTARYLEETGTIEWVYGAEGLKPVIKREQAFFRGRILFAKEYEVAFGITEEKKLGKIYEYMFDPSYPRSIIKKTVEEAGWEFVQVTSLKHVQKPVHKH